MKESTQTIEKRKQHLRDNSAVNRKHAEMMKSQSADRKQRSRLQARAEIMDNKNIDYKRYMSWLS
ncbi:MULTISPECIES: hypothetical protein [unclassified Leuconostoc]|uniref:hypothetical protein n=1 Tax=unclassified Leuconostoc TaxID=2685106 RepID=UPI001903CAEE|nr:MULTISPECIES: hypothetical protein [unclassified Leuconostoc]MBK0041506.1 hypothetical protein [Leuconostoc sp. S51]MBK0052489.1 hypothetical protein [Leuconostoc sp. S50]